jgi:hypothetical protein
MASYAPRSFETVGSLFTLAVAAFHGGVSKLDRLVMEPGWWLDDVFFPDNGGGMHPI